MSLKFYDIETKTPGAPKFYEMGSKLKLIKNYKNK